MKITSVNNELIKETSKLIGGKGKLYRDKTNLFIIEGDKGIQEAISAGLEVVNIFSVEGYEDFSQRIEVTEAVISKLSEAKTPPKAVAVVKKPKYNWSDNFNKVILLESIKDPGNLGTILRSASAFNIDAIVLYGDTVDLYNPKCVRSTVGNLWKIPVFKMNDLSIFEHYQKIATLPKGNNVVPLKNYKLTDKILVMFGSEADGLSDELKEIATENVTIEMSPNVESLNLSVSVSIIMYELFTK